MRDQGQKVATVEGSLESVGPRSTSLSPLAWNGGGATHHRYGERARPVAAPSGSPPCDVWAQAREEARRLMALAKRTKINLGPWSQASRQRGARGERRAEHWWAGGGPKRAGLKKAG